MDEWTSARSWPSRCRSWRAAAVTGLRGRGGTRARAARRGGTGPAGPGGSSGATGPAGPPGAKGDPGAPAAAPPASVGPITPRAGLLDRELDVTIAGSGTSFDASPTIDFGAGITVT